MVLPLFSFVTSYDPFASINVPSVDRQYHLACMAFVGIRPWLAALTQYWSWLLELQFCLPGFSKCLEQICDPVGQAPCEGWLFSFVFSSGYLDIGVLRLDPARCSAHHTHIHCHACMTFNEDTTVQKCCHLTYIY